MNKVNFTSVLLGKNQHTAPTRLPNTKPINSSMGPLKMLNTMFPVKREDMKYNSNFVIYNKKTGSCLEDNVHTVRFTKLYTLRLIHYKTSDKSDGMPLGPLIISKTSSKNETYFLHPNITFYCCIRHLNTTQLQTEARTWKQYRKILSQLL